MNEKLRFQISLIGPFTLMKDNTPVFSDPNAKENEAMQLMALLILAHTYLLEDKESPYYREVVAENVGGNKFIKPKWLCACLYPEVGQDYKQQRDDLNYLMRILHGRVPILKEDETRTRRSSLGIQLDLSNIEIDLHLKRAERPLLEGWNYEWLLRPDIQAIRDQLDRAYLQAQFHSAEQAIAAMLSADQKDNFKVRSQCRTIALSNIDKAACRVLNNQRLLDDFRGFGRLWQVIDPIIHPGSCIEQLLQAVQNLYPNQESILPLQTEGHVMGALPDEQILSPIALIEGVRHEMTSSNEPQKITREQMQQWLLTMRSDANLSMLITALGANLDVTVRVSYKNRVAELVQWADEQEGRMLELYGVAQRLFPEFATKAR